MRLLRLSQDFLALLIRQMCGISVFAKGIELDRCPQAIFYANHSSHFDFLAIWASLPQAVRERTRPVAAKDYWDVPGLRGYLSSRLFRALYVERNRRDPETDPLEDVKAALRAGDSVILFPEGTRSLDGCVQEFRKGLFHIAAEMPALTLVPVYLDNLNRILPKGEVILLPLLSRVIFGPPLERLPQEEKGTFLERARQKLVELQP